MKSGTNKGYVLVEVLTAAVLLSLAAGGLYRGLQAGIEGERKIHEVSRGYSPLRVFLRRLELDLRNTVTLNAYPFTGDANEIIFPQVQSRLEDGVRHTELHQIRYFFTQGAIRRTDQKLSNRLWQKNQETRIVFKNAEAMHFHFVYLDEEGEIRFEPGWHAEPYLGIPGGIKVNVKFQGQWFSKLISLPQGEWGHLQGKDTWIDPEKEGTEGTQNDPEK